ncbi:hypothetical protein QTH91_01040 [Variovorax dokdonensis]|uniref:Uncharacterized protein n=1 Tax=Variovorax dokdonensis TaxID=344883 RepID=A0ABT7N5A5_9BURK|nr:hypothetical protein [Variovorax dokdonensis]MDM0043055.1 hypothetical protein [Variovorax dokdonensis]
MATRLVISPKRRFEIPARLDEATLAAAVARRLASPEALPAGFAAPPPVVWVDGADEVLVHLPDVRVALRDRLIAVSVDLECDQTGRETLVMPFAVGGARDPAGLIAATESLPRGDGLLVGRWGRIVQDAVWAALLGVIGDYATRLNKLPFGFTAGDGVLSLRAAKPAELMQLKTAVRALVPTPPRGPSR